ncbi:Starch-binding associating with outer membrane [Spirosomataceae bacterium TFI 002]|nr:Starch-binding associating with outer membrane [Spirosomataceae bacterium TFI 002]
MKNMSNIKRMAFTALAVISVSFSCKDSFLDIPATSSLDELQLLSKQGVEGTLIGAYSVLNARGYSRLAAPNNWVYGSIMGGEANKGTDPGDFTTINPIQRYEIDPTNGEVNSTWNAKYEGISRCNATIRLAAASEKISEADRLRITGEARMLRGHYYFELKKLFNSVPYIDENMDYGKGIEEVQNSPAFWDKIEADFKFAMDNLPETQSQTGRVNKWAAASYLGKAYLYQKKYAEAKAIFTDVINNGQTSNGKKYALVPEFAQIFNAENDNHEESIFALQSAMNTQNVNNANWFDDLNYPYNTGPDGPGNCCGFFQPSFNLANSYRTKDGLPLLDGSWNTPANRLKDDYNVEANTPFTEDEGPVDPRLDHTVGRRGIPYLDWIEHPGKAWIRSQVYAGPYSPKKFVYYKRQENVLTDGSSWTRGYATMNFNIIRFADVLLMAAEAEIATGGLEKAREYTNMVRARAANKAGWVMEYDGTKPAANYSISLYSTPWTDAAVALRAVQTERMLELAQEGHRFFDLVRWGIASEEITKYLAHDGSILVAKLGGAKYTSGKNEYLPIPQGAIDVQGTEILKQNPGY